MATAEQPPRLTIRPARPEDAPALREIFNDAVEDGLATFDSKLRSIDEQKDLIAAANEDSAAPCWWRKCAIGSAAWFPSSRMSGNSITAKSAK